VTFPVTRQGKHLATAANCYQTYPPAFAGNAAGGIVLDLPLPKARLKRPWLAGTRVVIFDF
jgi:hypothetical protein